MIKKLIITLSILTSCAAFGSQPKALLLDLGGIFFNYSMMAHAQTMGIGRICAYIAYDWKNPSKLQKIIFEVVHGADYQLNPPLTAARTTRGIEFPPLLTAYQAGRISSEDALALARASFERMKAQSHFVSDREAELVSKGISIMFDPKLPVSTYYSIKDGIQVLKELAALKDENGNRKYLLIGLSNWDKESFPLVKERFKDEFALFDDCVISGDMGTIKPNREIYLETLRKHGLAAQECIFIDDQEENIKAAQALGIGSILFKEYAQLRAELNARGIAVDSTQPLWETRKPYLMALCGLGVACIAYMILRSSSL